MAQEKTEVDGVKYLAISVPENFEEGQVSASGKSISYRVKGQYLRSDGMVMGEEGKMSPLLRRTFAYEIRPQHYSFSRGNITKFAFGGDMVMPALLIKLNA